MYNSDDFEKDDIFHKIFGANPAMISEQHVNLRNRLKEMILNEHDEHALDLYVKLSSAQNRINYTMYARIFGLCRLLKVTDIFDIGCGTQYPLFLISPYQDMSYTGIDCSDELQYSSANELLTTYFDGRIKIKKAQYPFRITPRRNNIAIACGWLGEFAESEKDITRAFSRDFDRVLIDIHGVADFDISSQAWEREVTDFELYKINSNRMIVSTKFPEEIAVMGKNDYNYDDENFSIPYVDSVVV